jgi:gliding motility-associated-like protein
MKSQIHSLLLLIVASMLSLTLTYAGNDGWQARNSVYTSFIENKGQFDGRNWQKDSKIEYAVDHNGYFMFFTAKGVTYRQEQITRNPKKDPENPHEPKRFMMSELVSVNWVGANTSVEIVAENQVEQYYSYTMYENGNRKKANNINNIPGFTKLTYKNLYDNIDVVYELFPEKGIKYTIIARPGADISQVKMQYSRHHTQIREEFLNYRLNENGEMEITGSLLNQKELAPVSFYGDNLQEVKSSFKFENDILSFQVEAYDPSRTLIIDPWIINSTFTTSTAVWEVETDGAGNVYTIGGETPMKLQKYNAGGTLLWTYITPWDTASVWLGTLATDNGGDCFITSGTSPEIERVNTFGTMMWHSNGGALIGGDDEWWSITFNCDKTKLIVGGTKLFMLTFQAHAAIFNIDLVNGNILGSQYVNSMTFGVNTPIEVRSISSSKNAKYIYLTHNKVGAISHNIGACPTSDPIFQQNNGHVLGYKCENYLPATQNGGGLKAIVANDQYFYTHSGTTIYQRSLADGTLIGSATIPGGANQSVLGKIVVHNSGLAVDNCGNVYAGSVNRVIKFDANLNVLQDAPVAFTVYDVAVNNNGEVLAVGAQSNNGSTNRNGRIQSINMSACNQYILYCCDANICPVPDVCSDVAPFNLTVSMGGGVFSGPGITNSTLGTFDPSVAGPGSHWIVYTLACGSDSIRVNVIICSPPEACVELNGTLSASGGAGPVYSWETYTAASSTPISTQAQCVACGGSWTPFVNVCMIGGIPATSCNQPAGWNSFATGNNIPQPGSSLWPIRLYDTQGNYVEYTNLAAIPACSNCPPITITVDSQTNPPCNGGTGTATVSASGGTAPYTYQWTGGGTGATISGVTAGTYTVTATDATACTGTYTVTITQPAAVGLSLTASTPANCGANDGSATVLAIGGAGGFTYSWSGGQTGASVTGLAIGSYTVTATDASGCTATLNVSIAGSSGLTLTMSSVNSSCGASDGSATVSVSGGTTPYTYQWSPSGGTGATASNLAAGNYTVIVTDNSACTATGSATITSPNAPVVTLQNQTDVTCFGLANGSAAISVSGGTAPYTYQWSPSGGSAATASNLAANTYNISVTDAAGCVTPFQVTITQPAALSVTLASTPSACSGGTGTATATVSGGTPTYGYLWTPGSASANPATALTPGNYSVVVTDMNGCTVSGNVNVSGSPPVSITGTSTAVSCFGGSNGTATASPAGGTPGFTYQWSDAMAQSGQTAINLSAGSYTVTVTDTQGCTNSIQVNVNGPLTPLSFSISATQVLCSGQNNGTATATPAGGTPPYYYTWSNGSSQSTAQNLPTGNYCVTVTDSQGCTSTNCVDVTTPNPLILTLDVVNPLCFGTQGGQINATATGGTQPYTWLWSNGSGSPTITQLIAGTYTVTLTDGSGCSLVQTSVVTQPPQLSINISPSQYICPGSSVQLAIYPAGGIYPYTYYWNGAVSGSVITVSPNQTTTYTAFVTDANGCQSEIESTTIHLHPPMGMNASVSPDSICPGDPVVIAVSVWGGTGPPYLLIGQDSIYINSPYIYYPNTSVYYQITAHDGCDQTATATVPIHVYPQPPNSFLADTVRGCVPLTVNFFEYSPNQGQSYVWDFGDQTNLSLDKNPLHTYTHPGVYDVTLTVTSVYGCKTVNVQNDFITVYPLPNAAFTYNPQFASQIKPEIHFTNMSQMAVSYMWFFGTGDSSSQAHPTYIFPWAGSFPVTLIAISDKNCRDTAKVHITIQEQPSFYAPTAFSPDNDGTNDFWHIFATGIREEGFSLLVYDRWGEKVFESTSINKEWDGRIKDHRLAPIGTYTWLCIYLDNFGNKREKAGTVTIIR